MINPPKEYTSSSSKMNYNYFFIFLLKKWKILLNFLFCDGVSLILNYMKAWNVMISRMQKSDFCWTVFFDQILLQGCNSFSKGSHRVFFFLEIPSFMDYYTILIFLSILLSLSVYYPLSASFLFIKKPTKKL